MQTSTQLKLRQKLGLNSLLQNKKSFPYVLITPALAFLVVITIFPFLYILRLSLYDYSLIYAQDRAFIGLGNFVELFFHDSTFWPSLRTTGYFSSAAVCLELVLGLGIALLMNRQIQKNRSKRVIRTLLMFPLVATPIAVSYVWRIMYNPSLGIINYFFRSLSLPEPLWLADPLTALPSLIVVDVWQWTPFVSLIILAGLMSLPRESFEAASIDGASRGVVLWYITFPLLKPVFFVALFLRVIDSLKTFDIIYVMTGGGPIRSTETLNIRIYLEAFRFFEMGYSSALSVVMLFLTIFIMLSLIRFTRIKID